MNLGGKRRWVPLEQHLAMTETGLEAGLHDRLACVAGVKRGRGKGIWARVLIPFPSNACHAG